MSGEGPALILRCGVRGCLCYAVRGVCVGLRTGGVFCGGMPRQRNHDGVWAWQVFSNKLEDGSTHWETALLFNRSNPTPVAVVLLTTLLFYFVTLPPRPAARERGSSSRVERSRGDRALVQPHKVGAFQCSDLAASPASAVPLSFPNQMRRESRSMYTEQQSVLAGQPTIIACCCSLPLRPPQPNAPTAALALPPSREPQITECREALRWVQRSDRILCACVSRTASVG